jgi:hypothetical protein
MRFRNQDYHEFDGLLEVIGERFGDDLRLAQQEGLACWVYGTIQAHRSCETAVVRELAAVVAVDTDPGGAEQQRVFEAWRQRLREWLYAGADKAAPCHTEVDVSGCFLPLLRWVVDWWQDDALPLAIDATLFADQLTALVVSVLYRGSAIPVAWHILPANVEGAWLPHIVQLIRTLRPAVPAQWRTVVLVDRGLWSPHLWDVVREVGWHPVVRIRTDATFRAQGGKRLPVRALVPSPGHAWVGRGEVYQHRPARRSVTLIVIWAHGQKDPWVLLTDLAPKVVGVSWYALRFWIELGFRALKGVGWQWELTQRRETDRVARHWLVLAVATLCTLAVGTRLEDAAALHIDPARLHRPPPRPLAPRQRTCSVFARGLTTLRRLLVRRRLWRALWLTPEPWPQPPPDIAIDYLEDQLSA